MTRATPRVLCRSMSPILLRSLLAATLVALGADARIDAQPVRYELLSGSKIVDDCLGCDRVAIERPLSGSMTFELLDSLVCCIWEIANVDISDPEGDYPIRGGGMYGTSEISGFTQSMSLDLEIAGERGIRLASGDVAVGAPAPIVEITVTEDGSRDKFHMYTITLITAPVATERVRYELVPANDDLEKGSLLEIVCPNCALVEPVMPIAGSFELALSSSPASPFGIWALDAVALEALSDVWDIEIGGGGSYEHGGEVALLQRMRLRADVLNSGGVATVVLDSGRVAPGARFPEIVVDVDEGELHSGLNYRLHIVARPSDSMDAPFRRGDANDDGAVDISDAVRIFVWLFAGASAPNCLAAANTNGDRGHDLSDGIYLLQYLFQSGERPPAPGPVDCGPSEEPVFSCAAYGSCDA